LYNSYKIINGKRLLKNITFNVIDLIFHLKVSNYLFTHSLIVILMAVTIVAKSVFFF